ncbi:MAG: hypothetical protein IPM45_05955 [Acidimicrobiales bacterium]|nr:hypothetical protein [Acidimicrobiales bacterium]
MSPLRRRARSDPAAETRPAPRLPRAGQGWLLPRRFERGEGARWTPVGALGAAAPGLVDPSGAVTPRRGAWSLDWWVGADDRWHVPAREAALRQRLVDGVPVVETAMRVPSGDVVQRVYGAVGDGAEVIAVEWRNDSPVPVALAIAVRPFSPEGAAPVRSIDLDGEVVRVDGRPVLRLPRPPNRAAASTGAGGDVAEVVLAGGAPDRWRGAVHCDEGRATAAVVYPLPHHTTLRVVLGCAEHPPGDPAALPPPEQVARGWVAQDQRGSRLELPDARLAEAVRAARCSLLLAAAAEPARGTAAAVRAVAWAAAGLADHGFADEAGEALLACDLALDDGSALWALGRLLGRTGDRVLAETVVVSVAGAVERLARQRPVRATAVRGVAAAATVLGLAGEARAAADAERSAERLLAAGGVVADLEPLAGPTGGASGATGLAALVAAASPTWTWSVGPEGASLEAAGRFLVLVRDLLVADSADHLDLCSELPAGWWGQGFEVHGVPTRFGPAGYAVRWHGERPALLWEVDLAEGVQPPLLCSPGLDPAWRDERPAAEALLGPVARPAVGGGDTGPRDESGPVSFG